jgi:hypothetical protein
MAPIRYRRCPQCQTVHQASAFRRAGGRTGTPTFARRAERRQQCPSCGFIGLLAAFQPAERPAEPDEGAVS